MGDVFFSQDGQDRYLDQKVFSQKRSGTFVDIGANDGITLSNTYFLEKNRGWSGICIEPHPTAFEKLKANRNSIVVNACVSDNDQPGEFMKIEGYAEMLSGLVSKYDDSHVKRIERDLIVHGGEKQIITVPCHRLDTILMKYNLHRVDYCSIDTEGGEIDILETIDLLDFDVKVVSVENNYYGPTLKKYFKMKNYRFLAKVGADEFFVKKKKLFGIF